MSVVLDEQTDTVVLEHLDFNAPCIAPPDSHAAEFSITCRACGNSELMCSDHLLYFRNWLAVRGRQRVECKGCGNIGPTLDDVAEVMPL